MTDTELQIRGYDDRPFLKEMADGLVVRKYASVDEAAKSVLAEPGGSNVDRLRRKFREQNWYERGLKDYVEAEMARQGSYDEATSPEVPEEVTSAGRRYSGMQALIAGAGLLFVGQVKIAGAMVFLLVAVAMMAVAAANDLIDIAFLVAGSVTIAAIALMSWVGTTSVSASATQAVVSVTCLTAGTLSGVWLFATTLPHSGFTFGSVPGTFIGSIGLSLIGAYIGFFLWDRPTSSSRKGVTKALSIGAGILGCLSLMVANNDLRTVVREDQAKVAAWSRMAVAISQFKSENPAANIDTLRTAQKDVLSDLGQIVRR